MRWIALFAAALLACDPASSGDGPGANDDDDDGDGPDGPDGPGGPDGPDGPDGTPSGRRIIGYYPAWATYGRDYQVAEIPGDLLTHINYAFLDIANGECVLGDAYADIDKFYPGDSWDAGALRGAFHQLQLLKQRHPHLKTLLSIGGWTWSGGFSDLAATAAGRERFARSCADIMERYDFDGLDVDWEYPGGGGLSPGVPADRANFTLLLAAMRAELDRRGEFLLTIAAPAGGARIADIEVDRIHQHLDWINVMTYDFHGGWERVTGFNAPLAAVPGDPSATASTFHVAAAVDAWLDGGTPPAKLIAGVPFYGRGWSGVPATNHGLFQSATGAPMGTWEAGVFDWHDLAANYLPRMQRHWSEAGQVPWLYDAATGVMISYDDPGSLRAKVGLVRQEGLGGVMFWELSGDDAQSTLLRAVNDALAP